MSGDKTILRDLAEQYMEIALDPKQEERRKLWSDHLSLKETRPPIIAGFGMWNVWAREVFADSEMKCEDPFYRQYERWFRMAFFQDDIDDDTIQEPWITLNAVHTNPGGIYGEPWGVAFSRESAHEEGGSWKGDAPIKEWADMDKLSYPNHSIDEEKTSENIEKLHEAVGGIIDIDVNRAPHLLNFAGDISTTIAALRGLERIMLDMYEFPDEYRKLLEFLRDGILANQQTAEDAGDFSMSTSMNQSMPYCDELESPSANSGPRKRKELWGFFAAQEHTLISPQFHDEFLFEYQLPIMENFGLTHYGCCEDLTQKIDMLRTCGSLRSIAVTPTADVAKCAEQIGLDYALSYRPNPADMVCCGYDENKISRIVGGALESCKGQRVHINLKDVETMEGENDRMKRWVVCVRTVIDSLW